MALAVEMDTRLEPPPRVDNGGAVVVLVVVSVVVVVMPCKNRRFVTLSANVEAAVLDTVVPLRACVDENKTRREQTTIDTMDLF